MKTDSQTAQTPETTTSSSFMPKERKRELIDRHPSFEKPDVPDVRPAHFDGGPPDKTAPTVKWVIYHHRLKQRAPSDPWEQANLKWAEATLKYRANVPYEDRFWWCRDPVQDYHRSLELSWMAWKVMVYGARNFDNSVRVEEELNALDASRPIKLIMHANDAPAAQAAIEWARSNSVRTQKYPAMQKTEWGQTISIRPDFALIFGDDDPARDFLIHIRRRMVNFEWLDHAPRISEHGNPGWVAKECGPW